MITQEEYFHDKESLLLCLVIGLHGKFSEDRQYGGVALQRTCTVFMTIFLLVDLWTIILYFVTSSLHKIL